MASIAPSADPTTPSPLDRLLRPRSVAVVGASRAPGGVGRRVLDALVRHGFTGPVFPVNPQAHNVGSIRAYASLADIGEPVDLVVIAVPADQVADAAAEAADAGARFLVVISAGFAEAGEVGARRQQELTDRLRGTGVRMVGPNCLGILTTDPAVSMNASFAPEMPPPGSVALCSQSGALGIAVIELARRLQLGLSSFVSIGNQADLSLADMVEHWGASNDVDVTLLYVEAFADPRRFRAVAEAVTPEKPIVLVKAGRTEPGSRAAGSHTAALAGVDTAVDALARQANLIRARSLHEMFDIARSLTSQPLPDGRRVAIVTNSGGPAILCVDALSEQGFAVDRLPEPLRKSLHRYLPDAAGTTNPVDMLAGADAETYYQAVRELLVADEVDILVVVYTPVGISSIDEVKDAIARAVRAARMDEAGDKPVLACIVGEDTGGDADREIRADQETIPVYSFPEQVAVTLGAMRSYAEGRRRSRGHPVQLTDREHAAVTARLEAGRSRDGWLPAATCRDVLDAAGITPAPGRVVADADEALEVAAEVGYPVAVSVASTDIIHKSEHGVVRLGLTTPDEVRSAHRELTAAADRLDATVDGVLVTPMLDGTELLVGVERTPDFGPLLAAGLGGTRTEVLNDVAFRLTPVSDTDAHDMLRSLRSWPLLTGYRTVPPADVAAVVDLIRRVSALVEAVPEIAELDLNPVFAHPDGCAVADVRIRVTAPDSPRFTTLIDGE